MLKRRTVVVAICLVLVTLLSMWGVVAQPARRAPAGDGLNERAPLAETPGYAELGSTQQVVLQPLSGSEEVLVDTMIWALEPDTSKGSDPVLNVQSTSNMERYSLLRWNLEGNIPSGSRIVSAEMTLSCFGRTRDWDLTVDVYPMLTAWDEATATWNRASEGVPWSTAGTGAGDDRTALAAASTTALGATEIPAWVSWNLTEVVQDWVDNPQDNHGLILIGTGGSVRYDFQSSEHGASDGRPKLIIEYEENPITATPTATLTPQYTHTPTNTPTPTRTSTPTDVPATWLDVSQAIPAYCKAVITGNNTGRPSIVTQYDDVPHIYNAPEDVYVLNKTVTSDLTVRLEWQALSIDLDVLLLSSADPDSLMGGEGVGWGDYEFTYPNLGPGSYYIVVDGLRESHQGTYIISIQCEGEPTPTPTLTNTPARSFYPLIVRQAPPTLTPTPTHTASPTPTITPTFVPYGVGANCGGEVLLVASDGWSYSPDQAYNPGGWGFIDTNSDTGTWSTDENIYLTEDDALYQTHRYAMEQYAFDVAPARYEVQLHFSEVFPYTHVGSRVFDVMIEDSAVLTSFDMVDRGLKYTAFTHIVEVDVTDGTLNIAFTPQSQDYGPAINGIRVGSIGPAIGQ